jgi:hypothetical protein
MGTVIQIAPLMWVVPGDLFRLSNAADLEPIIAESFSCETWLLNDNRALAFSFRELLTNRGVPLDYGRFLQVALPVFRYLEPFLLDGSDSLDLDIPGSKFWTRLYLLPREVDNRSCMHIRTALQSQENVKLRVYSTRPLSRESATRIQKFLTDWIRQSSEKCINGERLEFSFAEMVRYQVPYSARSYGEDGFEILLDNWQAATWPWLEFYLFVRQTFPKRERLSLCFAHR